MSKIFSWQNYPRVLEAVQRYSDYRAKQDVVSSWEAKTVLMVVCAVFEQVLAIKEGSKSTRAQIKSEFGCIFQILSDVGFGNHCAEQLINETSIQVLKPLESRIQRLMENIDIKDKKIIEFKKHIDIIEAVLIRTEGISSKLELRKILDDLSDLKCIKNFKGHFKSVFELEKEIGRLKVQNEILNTELKKASCVKYPLVSPFRHGRVCEYLMETSEKLDIVDHFENVLEELAKQKQKFVELRNERENPSNPHDYPWVVSWLSSIKPGFSWGSDITKIISESHPDVLKQFEDVVIKYNALKRDIEEPKHISCAFDAVRFCDGGCGLEMFEGREVVTRCRAWNEKEGKCTRIEMKVKYEQTGI
jgi:hypothetical protein